MGMAISIEDRLAIQDMLGRYSWYFDEGQHKEWAALFTLDGVFEGATPQPVQGREALARLVQGNAERTKGMLRHLSASMWMETGQDADTLIVRYYSQVSTWGKGGGELMLMAVCTTVCVRDEANGSWLIRRNNVKVLK